MADYEIDFENLTPDTWTLCVYQESLNKESVSWKQTTVPKNGISGVQWNIQYLVGVVNYTQEGEDGGYIASQKINTELGKGWKYESGFTEVGDAIEGQLNISNQSGVLANLAIGLDGDITVVEKNVRPGGNAKFIVESKFYLALFKEIVQGEVIPEDFVAQPLEILFQIGQTKKQCVAKLEEGNLVFEEVGTDNRVTTPYDQI